MEKIEKSEEFLLDLFAKDALNAYVTAWLQQGPNNKAIVNGAIEAKCTTIGEYLAVQSYNVATDMIIERRKRLKAE